MPAELRAKILTDADKYFGKTEEKQEARSFVPEKNAGQSAVERVEYKV